MSGRKAKAARRLFKWFQESGNFDPVPTEVRHFNVRQHVALVASKEMDPSTGLLKTVPFSYTTSTQVIPAKRFYRGIKRDVANGVI